MKKGCFRIERKKNENIIVLFILSFDKIIHSSFSSLILLSLPSSKTLRIKDA